MSRLRRVVVAVFGGIGALLVVQTITYRMAADAVLPSTIEGLLPPTSRCPDLLARGNWLDALPPVRRRQVESLLKAKYSKVYLDELDIPESSRAYDSNGGDVVWLVELKGVCGYQWFVEDSGPFWFQSTYSTDMGMQYQGAARITYVWLLFRWVDVQTDIGWHA